jgi:two-component system sensor histidine kinase HydH
MNSFRNRWLGSVLLISLCLAALSATMALSLVHQQRDLAQDLRGRVAVWRTVTELDECLFDLLVLLKARVEAVDPLHKRARKHLDDILASRHLSKDAREQAETLNLSFGKYLDHWRAIPPRKSARHEAALAETIKLFEADLVAVCNRYQLEVGLQVEEAATRQEVLLRRLAWGMALTGSLGAIAGLILGFGVAYTVSRSIRRLQVQIRDAAGIMGETMPEVVLLPDGQMEGLGGQIDLLTGRITQMVQQLRQREREVIRAEQLAAVGQLAAGVAHEIRNPLTSIKMLVQAGLQEDAPLGLAGDDLRIIEQEIRRMERSLQSFLDFARPPKAVRRPMKLMPMLHSVMALLQGRAQKQKVEIRLDSTSEDIQLVADEEQLRQVVVNLALNSLDAMPNGGTIHVSVRKDDSGRVYVRVADTGPGIPADIIPRLFQPFASSKETGLGLGLVVSKRIIEDHGGNLEAENRPQGGARFRITLPSGADA